MSSNYVYWSGGRVKLTWKNDTALPPKKLTTSAHGFCFKNNKLLLVNINHRGWDFPGGHVEDGETAEECLQREAYEEGYVTGSCSLLGHIIVDHHDNPNWNEASTYPKIGYQVFYRMDINELHDFDAKYETKERILIDPRRVADYYHNWNVIYQEILDNALKQ
ncbi:NUDIX hydrolase [Sutcliffiella cohnii]|uniref:NUDIX hydrolase n=1 Tax=Sutcliffiella cohnii TaxID=33932 RepID=A0A223KPH8_9BACI|nr:NUDIX domain-containing protein [Sutcliffiella cohnii]AST91233.1 NUDIX hydrolase [Sutcliffiella cohnii]